MACSRFSISRRASRRGVTSTREWSWRARESGRPWFTGSRFRRWWSWSKGDREGCWEGCRQIDDCEQSDG